MADTVTSMSVRVENMIQTGEDVLNSFKVHGRQVAKVLSHQLSSISEDEIYKMLEASTQLLVDKTDALRECERAYIEEKSDDLDPRLTRDLENETSRHLLSQAANRLESLPTKQNLLLTFGFPNIQPRNPAKMLSVLEGCTNLLSKAKEDFIDSFGQKVPLKELGKTLAKQAKKLKDSLDNVKREKRELEDELLFRNRAMDEWKIAYRSVASILEGYYRLADLPELAERIRPTSRRRQGDITPTPSTEEPNE